MDCTTKDGTTGANHLLPSAPTASCVRSLSLWSAGRCHLQLKPASRPLRATDTREGIKTWRVCVCKVYVSCRSDPGHKKVPFCFWLPNSVTSSFFCIIWNKTEFSIINWLGRIIDKGQGEACPVKSIPCWFWPCNFYYNYNSSYGLPVYKPTFLI